MADLGWPMADLRGAINPPSAMKIYPSSAEEKLGFDVLRARLAEYVLSALGEERLETMRPSRTLDWVQAELERVAALQDAFRFDDPVPLDRTNQFGPSSVETYSSTMKFMG